MKDVDVEAVFLHPDEPALEFEGFLRKKYPRVRYFQVSISFLCVFRCPFNSSVFDMQGSLMEGDDLDRVQADNADAVIILTNKYCQVGGHN